MRAYVVEIHVVKIHVSCFGSLPLLRLELSPEVLKLGELIIFELNNRVKKLSRYIGY